MEEAISAIATVRVLVALVSALVKKRSSDRLAHEMRRHEVGVATAQDSLADEMRRHVEEVGVATGEVLQESLGMAEDVCGDEREVIKILGHVASYGLHIFVIRMLVFTQGSEQVESPGTLSIASTDEPSTVAEKMSRFVNMARENMEYLDTDNRVTFEFSCASGGNRPGTEAAVMLVAGAAATRRLGGAIEGWSVRSAIVTNSYEVSDDGFKGVRLIYKAVSDGESWLMTGGVPPDRHSLSVVVAGKSGVGKSTLCNLLSQPGGSATPFNVQRGTTGTMIPRGLRISRMEGVFDIVDSPGFDDPNGLDAVFDLQLRGRLASLGTLSLIIFVVKTSSERGGVRPAELEVMDVYKRFYGPRFLSSLVVVVTSDAVLPTLTKRKALAGWDEVIENQCAKAGCQRLMGSVHIELPALRGRDSTAVAIGARLLEAATTAPVIEHFLAKMERKAEEEVEATEDQRQHRSRMEKITRELEQNIEKVARFLEGANAGTVKMIEKDDGVRDARLRTSSTRYGVSKTLNLTLMGYTSWSVVVLDCDSFDHTWANGYDGKNSRSALNGFIATVRDKGLSLALIGKPLVLNKFRKTSNVLIVRVVDTRGDVEAKLAEAVYEIIRTKEQMIAKWQEKMDMATGDIYRKCTTTGASRAPIR